MSRKDLRSWAILAAVIVALVAGVVVWYRLTWGRPPDPPDEQDSSDTTADVDDEPEPPNEADPPKPGVSSEPRAPRPTAEISPPRPRRKGVLHSADPCESIPIATLPTDYPRVTTDDVTIAWPPGDPPVEDAARLGRQVAQILSQAALLTGTTSMSEVTVVVYPTRDDYLAKSGAPTWSSGLYTGIVHLPRTSKKPPHVNMTTLQHELMHAQLHSAVGCMPVWFNEGLAQRFSERAPRKRWLRMLRDQKLIDFNAMSVSTVEDVHEKDVQLVYAQSLAMVLYVESASPVDALEDAVGDLTANRYSRTESLKLWERLRPGATANDVLQLIAGRMFDVHAGPQLVKQLNEQAVCCLYPTQLSRLRCYFRAPAPAATSWLDPDVDSPSVCTIASEWGK